MKLTPVRARFGRTIACAIALSIVVAACSTADTSTDPQTGGTETSAPGSPDGGATLADICPNPLVIQTDWFPEPEHGGLYQLIGPDGTVDPNVGIYSGEIGDTGVFMEIRIGGPFVGFQTVTSQLYTDPDIFMGYVSTDESIIHSEEFPTVAVMAPLERSPQALLYDPDTFPDLTWENLADSDATVLYFEGGSFMTYLVGKGLVRADQVDSSYDGSPARFVAEDNIVQAGYVSNDVFKYEHIIEQWLRPVGYLLTDDAGYRVYTSAMAVTPEVLESGADCLEGLVPMMQQAQIDYVNDPVPVNDMMLTIVDDIASFWVLSAELNQFAVEEMIDLGIVGNGPDDTLGNFDLDRVGAFIDEAVPFLEESGIDGIKEGLTPDQIVTNEFIDPSIGF